MSRKEQVLKLQKDEILDIKEWLKDTLPNTIRQMVIRIEKTNKHMKFSVSERAMIIRRVK